MSKESKIIKDLKERNYKLATQYRYKDIRCASLEQKNKKYEEVIDKVLELNEKVINMREQGFSYEQYKPYLLKQHNMLKEVKDK